MQHRISYRNVLLIQLHSSIWKTGADRFGQDLKIVCLETPQVDLASEFSLTKKEAQILQNAPYDRPPDSDLVIHGPTDPGNYNENMRYELLYDDLYRDPSRLLPDEEDVLSDERQKQRLGPYSYFIEDRFDGCVVGMGMYYQTLFDPYSQDFLLESQDEEGEKMDLILWGDRYFFTKNILWDGSQADVDKAMAKKVADEADFRHVMEEASALWESIPKETWQPRK